MSTAAACRPVCERKRLRVHLVMVVLVGLCCVGVCYSIRFVRYAVPSLTTVAQPKKELGREALSMQSKTR